MGFDAALCERALAACKNDENQALDWLFANSK